MEPLLSHHTRRALKKKSTGYLSKETSEQFIIQTLQKTYNLSQIYRFDIGKNSDGFSPTIQDMLATPETRQRIVENILEYPDTHYTTLRNQLAKRFDLPSDFFMLSAGIESFLDTITRASLNTGETYLLPVPNFYLFEDMSERMGAVPYTVPLSANTFRWTSETTDTLIQVLMERFPKLLWISNPINPTGQHIPLDELQRVIDNTSNRTIIVFDEAYGECTDTNSRYVSAAQFVAKKQNIIVLRTFSKLYGLPSARVGYMICSSPILRRAIHYYRPYFPFSGISLFLAQMALLDETFIFECRERIQRRRASFIDEAKQLTQFQFIPSDTNTIMFRHSSITADALFLLLAKQGVLTANINGVTGIKNEQFLRMTLRTHHDNSVFLNNCKKINNSQ